MGFFSKKKEVVDLGALYKKQKEKSIQLKNSLKSEEPVKTEENNSGGFLGFFNMGNQNNSETSPSVSEPYENNDSAEDKRKRLAKRLKDMTDKIEDLSNQIYHLQQRIEVLERKGSSTLYS